MIQQTQDQWLESITMRRPQMVAWGLAIKIVKAFGLNIIMSMIILILTRPFISFQISACFCDVFISPSLGYTKCMRKTNEIWNRLNREQFFSQMITTLMFHQMNSAYI